MAPRLDDHDPTNDDPTNDQIALLCEIGEHDLAKCSADKRRDLEWLLAQGYVEPAKEESEALLQLTAKGSDFLSERGAGLNEA